MSLFQTDKFICFVRRMSLWSFHSGKALWETFRYNWQNISNELQKLDLRTRKMCIISLKWRNFSIVEFMPLISLEWRFFSCCGFSSYSRMFHTYGDISITDNRLKKFSYARQLWTLSSEGFLECHSHCDTGHPFSLVISEEPWHSYLLPSASQWSCHYLF